MDKRKNGLYYDPVEDTEEYKRIIDDIEKEVDERMKDYPNGMGNCHIYWNIKKELLRKKNINWRSPKECNPHVIFD